MGIEPTCETFVIPHNGFEDRDRHQAGTHFLKMFAIVGVLLLVAKERASRFVNS